MEPMQVVVFINGMGGARKLLSFSPGFVDTFFMVQ
jgi:hypothetical protein